MKIKYNDEKLKTHISGLDDLLFGGLHLQTISDNKTARPLNIVICGEVGTSKSLLAMQMLHGITKSLHELECNDKDSIELGTSVFYTQDNLKGNVSDMLVDVVLSQCIRKVVKANITENTDEKGNAITWNGNLFCKTLFEVPECITYPIDLSKLDSYIANEILVYNTRTNSLHVGLPSTSYSRGPSDTPITIKRRHDDLGEFCTDSKYPTAELKGLASEFFPVEINNIKDIGTCGPDSSSGCKIPCLVLDKRDGQQELKYEEQQKSERALVVIHIEKSYSDFDGHKADIIIEMRTHTEPTTNYLCNQLSIRKSVLQDTALGWHQYKKRDYGIEVYPSTHVILQRRRHMPQGIQRAHVGVLHETYQYFIDRDKDYECVSSLSEYINNMKQPDERFKERLNKLYKNFSKSDCPEDILNSIFIKESDSESQITAIIGSSNTYKRYLTLGGVFSACSHNEHTLHILLDKDDDIVLKRMICPATVFKEPNEILQSKCESCLKCYKRIHFMEIRMGCISTEEFFYYLVQQLQLSREAKDKSKQIKRIVLDDLQKIEFSFPLMDQDSLFLPGLISICKDYDIDLFILCDKSSKKVSALRSNADNVICTRRSTDSDFDLDIYIERYAGYSSPSHIWGCHITDIKDLFYCDSESRSKDNQRYHLNGKNLRGFRVNSLDKYWNNETQE